MRFQCNRCRAILELEDIQPGELVQCPTCKSPVATPCTTTSPGAVVGDFVIKKEIGKGGMGTVYLAHQTTLDRDIALKILHSEYAEDINFIQNFINEARAVACFNHPNIVKAIAVNNDGGLWYFAMEYINGETLKSLLEQNGPLTARKLLDIATEIISALKYAWDEKQVVHRDIKPDNIILGADGYSKLADLGLARKITENSQDGGTELYGTPQYIAPELLLGTPFSVASDIYSLGATFYHAITGQYPYSAATPEETVSLHLSQPLKPLAQIVPSISAPLATFIEIMMAKRPAHRYQNYDDLMRDLELVKHGKMPIHELSSIAQTPIDNGSLELSAGASASSETTRRTTGKTKLKFTKTPHERTANAQESAAASQPMTVTLSSANGTGKLVLHEPSPSSKGKTFVLILLLLLLIGGGGAAAHYFLRTAEVNANNNDETTDETISAVENSKLSKLQRLIADKADAEAVLAEAAVVAATLDSQSPEYGKYLELTGTEHENALERARISKLEAAEQEWQDAVKLAAAERERQQAAEEQRQHDEIRKKQEAEEAAKAAKAQAEREAEEKQRLEMTAADKAARLAIVVQEANNRDFSGARESMFKRFEHENDELKAWRSQWEACLNDAEDFWELLRTANEKLAGAQINDFAMKNSRYKLNPANFIEPMWTIAKVDGEMLFLEYKTSYNLQGKDAPITATWEKSLKSLRLEQLETLLPTLGNLQGKTDEDTRQALGAYAFVCGIQSQAAYEKYNLSALYPALQADMPALSPKAFLDQQIAIVKKCAEVYQQAENKDNPALQNFTRTLCQIQTFSLYNYLRKNFPSHQDLFKTQIENIVKGDK